MLQQSPLALMKLVSASRCVAMRLAACALAAGIPLSVAAQGTGGGGGAEGVGGVGGAAGRGVPQPTVHVGQPEGYIGIVYSGDQRMQMSLHRRDGRVISRTLLVSHAAYPVIVSVEPGSPAERAGLIAGDTVLSYNGKDVVSEPFPLFDMLRPGARLNMRIRRSGAVRNVAVTVGRRNMSHALVQPGVHYVPSAEIAAEIRREVERARTMEVERARTQAQRSLEQSGQLSQRDREQMRQEMERAAREIAAVSPAGLVPFTTVSISAVAGAEMTPLNDDLAGVLGVRRGVFVVRVNPGTPAAQSGLRGGDVIVSVGDSTVADLSQLRRAINAEQRRIRSARGERAIPLRIVRNKRNQRLTLNY